MTRRLFYGGSAALVILDPIAAKVLGVGMGAILTATAVVWGYAGARLRAPDDPEPVDPLV